MTPKQREEMERLKRRVKILEDRNRQLTLSFSKGSVDRFAWLMNEIEDVCPRPGVRGTIRVSYSDAKLIRPILEAIVDPTSARG